MKDDGMVVMKALKKVEVMVSSWARNWVDKRAEK